MTASLWAVKKVHPGMLGKCPSCGKPSLDYRQDSMTVYCRYLECGYSKRDNTSRNRPFDMSRSFDMKDARYRAADPTQHGEEGHILHAEYDKEQRLYMFKYRDHGMAVQESEIMWDAFPMQTLAKMASEFMRSVNRKVGWDWEPRDEKLEHKQLLARLEAIHSD